MQDKFFGSKLNTGLLIILIILLAIAIKIMLQNKQVYLPEFSQPTSTQTKTSEPASIQNILGNKDDLISFSIRPFSNVHGTVSYRGSIKGGYFFEGNILIGVADINKKIIRQSNGVAKTDWMTSGPVDFEGNIDFSGLPKGPAYLEIHNDNPSGLTENDKSILIPIVIE